MPWSSGHENQEDSSWLCLDFRKGKVATMRLEEAILWFDGLVAAFVAGWGLIVMYLPDPNFRLARRLFWIAAGGMGVFAVVWNVTSVSNPWLRVGMTAVIGAITAVLLCEALRWAYLHETGGTAPATVHIMGAAQISPRPAVTSADQAHNLYRPREVRGSIPVSISNMGEPQYAPRANFSSRYEDDAAAFMIPDVFISNVSTNPPRQIALRLFLEVKGPNQTFTLNADGKDSFGHTLGVDDWGYQEIKKHYAEPPFVYLRSPVLLKPGDTVHGKLAFVVGVFQATREIPGDTGKQMKEAETALANAALQNKLTFKLTVLDEVSGDSVVIPLPGSYRGE
jgi:hypothetical protein